MHTDNYLPTKGRKLDTWPPTHTYFRLAYGKPVRSILILAVCVAGTDIVFGSLPEQRPSGEKPLPIQFQYVAIHSNQLSNRFGKIQVVYWRPTLLEDCKKAFCKRAQDKTERTIT